VEQLSRRRIHLAELQRLSSQGIPDSGSIRPISWKVREMGLNSSQSVLVHKYGKKKQTGDKSGKV
jgi:hypothetical protein